MGKLTFESGFKPTIDPWTGTADKGQIDRCQNFDPSITLPQDGIRQLGSDGVQAWIKGIMDAKATVKQWEYGKLEIFRKFANVEDSVKTITLPNFDAAAVTVSNYLTNTSGEFYATQVVPQLRLSGFSVGISNAKALVERNFTLEGNDFVVFYGTGKYFIKKEATVSTGEVISGNFTVALTDPIPVIDPATSGYIYMIIRVRGSASEELNSTQYTYSNSTHNLIIAGADLGDVYKIYHTGATYITGQDPFTPNTTDKYGVRASYCKIYLGVGTQLKEVTSATLDVTITREDPIGIGFVRPIERGVTDREVKITLGDLANSDMTIEEYLAGVIPGFGKIDYSELATDLTVIVAIYDSEKQDNFLMGYRASIYTRV